MGIEQFSSESNKPALEDIVKKAISDINALFLPEEIKKEIKIRRSDPLSGAEANFTFIKQTISPIIFRLHDYANGSDGDLKTGFRVEFGIRSVSDPERKVKFIAYNGIKLYLCLFTGDGEDDFHPLKEIREKQDLKNLCKREGEEGRKAIYAFGKISEKGITLNIIHTIESLVPSASVVSDSNFNLNFKPKSNFPATVGAFFTRHKKN